MTKRTKVLVICICVVVFALAICGLTACNKSDKLTLNNVKAEQIDKEQRVKVSWDVEGTPNQVVITVKKSNGTVDSMTTITNATLLAKGYTTIDASYGLNDIEIEISNRRYSDKKTIQAEVYTDEYVIAPLVATMPVTLFSLKLSEITNNYTIPTFVWLQRGMAWNYKEMPENVHLIPVDTLDTMAGYLGTNYWKMYVETSKWVGELYKMNNNSKFHFYVNDYHPFVWLESTYLNRIPTNNYDVTLLTDGTASNFVFESLYIKESAAEDYNDMVTEYNKYKQNLWDKNNQNLYNIVNVLNENDRTRNWILPMLKEEPNVRLILTRDYFNDSNNANTHETIKQYVNELKAEKKIEVVNLYTLLNALSETDQHRLKTLYNLGDSLFQKAVTENKKVMVILGTRTTNENSNNFEEYVAATKAYYGDEYIYYYKGHPWTPTASDPAKAEKLEEMGLIDVDSSIAAELIFYFNPDIATTGYSSTTFGSLNENQVGGIFNQTLDNALKTYSPYTKFVINKKDLGDGKYDSIAKAGNYIFEFANNEKYDVGVYDTKTDKIKYYKANGSEYTEVK